MPAQDTARFRARLVLIVAIAVIAATCGLAIDAGRHVSSGKDGTDTRMRITALAGELAIDFTSIDYRTFEQNTQRIAARATPEFAKKYRATVAAFAPLYRRGKVILTTSIQAAGLTSLAATSATAVVALSGTETSATSSSPVPQEFRMQIGLQKIGKHWLASQVEQL